MFKRYEVEDFLWVVFTQIVCQIRDLFSLRLQTFARFLRSWSEFEKLHLLNLVGLIRILLSVESASYQNKCQPALD